MGALMGVYLLHSSVPLVRSNGAVVKHYLGWCSPGMLPRRLHEHETGRHSAKVVQAFLEKGGVLSLGNYWPRTNRHDEKRMKLNGHLTEKCLVCQLEALTRTWMEMTNRAVSESEFDDLLPEPSPCDPPPQSGTTTPRDNGSWGQLPTADRT
jgi:hypothetical protein